MSHILFLENRHQTRTWELVASGLRERGHTISWLVMNHGYAPQGENVHLIPYPRKRDLTPVGMRFARIIESDRGIGFYGKNADHYVHYDRHITQALKESKPDLVVGEATQFYELLTIEACKALKIPYVFPTSARYPTGRFLFYRYDTLDVVGGSREAPSEEVLNGFVQSMARRTITPDYMKGTTSRDALKAKWSQKRDWPYKALQYVRGERYSSPSPWRKLVAEVTNHRNLKAWNERAQAASGRVANERKIRVLYPLHMQPEASVDVWGRPYNNQAALIREFARAVGRDGVILVKPNPKSKCEISNSLLEVAATENAVIPLSSSVKMQDVFESTDLFVTVTGTVALEAIFARKPCATLIRTRNNDLRGCRFLASPQQLGGLVKELGSGCFPMHTGDDVTAFAKRLYAESYQGILQDPFSAPRVASPENRKRLVDAMDCLIHELLPRDLAKASLASD